MCVCVFFIFFVLFWFCFQDLVLFLIKKKKFCVFNLPRLSYAWWKFMYIHKCIQRSWDQCHKDLELISNCYILSKPLTLTMSHMSHRSPPIMLTIELRMVIKFEHVVQSLVNTYLIGDLFLDLHLTIHHSNTCV